MSVNNHIDEYDNINDIDDIDNLLCEVNLYVLKYADMLPMTFVTNKSYESFRVIDTNIFSKIFKKQEKIYWKFTENQIDNLIIKCNQMWDICLILQKKDFSFVIDYKN